MTLTRRMNHIIKRMKAGELIEENRDAFWEKSTYWLGDSQITKPMLSKLCEAGLIVSRRNVPRYHYGEFVTSETEYSIPPVDCHQGFDIYQYTDFFWCQLPEYYTEDGLDPDYFKGPTIQDCIDKINERLAVIQAAS